MRGRLTSAVGALLLTAGSSMAAFSAPAAAALSVPARAAGTFVSLPPARVLDTRTGLGGLAPHDYGSTKLRMLGVGNVPATDVAEVVLNVTVAAPTTAGWLKVNEGMAFEPAGTNVNFAQGQTVANLVATRVGTDGTVKFISGAYGTIQLIADVVGYYTGGTPVVPGAFVAVTPSRLMDTRTNSGSPAPGPRRTAHLQIAGRGGVPVAGVSAIVLNLAVTRATAPGYITAYPNGTARPVASNVNFTKAATRANLVTVPLGTDGRVAFYNGSSGTTQLIGDIAGYYLAGTATATGAFVALPSPAA